MLVSDTLFKFDRLYFVDFALGIQPEPGKEVPLTKVQEFIEYLRRNLHYPIASVSADTFQSKQTLQNLQMAGFETTSLSVDRPPEGRDSYMFLKSLVNEKRILLPKNERLFRELKQLRDDGKYVDHKVGCFTGDTVIKMLDGNNKTMKELAELGPDNEFWVYACKPDGTIVPAKAYNAHKTKVASELIEITLDNDRVIRCTPEHPIMLRNGEYKEAQYLHDDSLMSCIGDKGNELTHKVKSIKRITDVQEDVYDITVPEYNNFALYNGIFVHNSTKDIADAVCGCIWNCYKSNNIINKTKVTSKIYSQEYSATPYTEDIITPKNNIFASFNLR